MRVLMLNSERGWRGGEVQTLLTCTGLIARDCAVTLGCPAGTPLAIKAHDCAVPLIDLSMRGSLALASVWRLRRWLAANPVDLIHAHTSHAHSAAALALIGSRIPLVVSRRVMFPLSASRFTRWKFARAQRVIAVSQPVRTQVIADGLPPEGIEVIPDGIDLAAVTAGKPGQLRSDLNLASETPLVVCVANLSPDKDHDTLLRAWQQVEHSNAAAHLALVGRGERLAALRSLATELGLRRLHVAGFREDIPSVLADADVVVLTSVFEGLGSILIEAQACGKPVVATRAGGIPEAVADGITGLLAAPGDPRAIADAMIRLLADPALRSHYGAAGRQRAADGFSAAVMVDAHVRLYRRVTSGTSST